jgi:hypothetical protein
LIFEKELEFFKGFQRNTEQGIGNLVLKTKTLTISNTLCVLGAPIFLDQAMRASPFQDLWKLFWGVCGHDFCILQTNEKVYVVKHL